jgi:hypothetical protein
MIIAWVLSLLFLLSSLVHHLERLAALEVISVNTYLQSHQQFIAAEKALLECEQHLSNIAGLENAACHVQSAGKNLWLISTKEKPVLEVLVWLDEQTNLVTRLHWRQQFE